MQGYNGWRWRARRLICTGSSRADRGPRSKSKAICEDIIYASRQGWVLERTDPEPRLTRCPLVVVDPLSALWDEVSVAH